jgi:hypothetical protein
MKIFHVSATIEKGRIRRVVRCIHPPHNPEPLVSLARQLLLDFPSDDALVIFAYSDQNRFDRGFPADSGRVFLSRDGRGWLGDFVAFVPPTSDQLGYAFFWPTPTSKTPSLYPILLSDEFLNARLRRDPWIHRLLKRFRR